MSLTIEDEATVAAIKRLAERTGRSFEATVRHAVEAKAASMPETSETVSGTSKRGVVSQAERDRRRVALKAIQDEYASWPQTGLKVDKAFFDSLNDDDI